MKIEFKQGLSGPAYSYNPGDIDDIKKEKAIRFCEAGIATPVKEKVVEKAIKDDSEEKQILTIGDLEQKKGGWYEFPDESKVRGEKKAKEKLEKWNEG